MDTWQQRIIAPKLFQTLWTGVEAVVGNLYTYVYITFCHIC